MLRLEDVEKIFIELERLHFLGSSEDEEFLKMVFENACTQKKVSPLEIEMTFDRVGFMNIYGKIVNFKISSSYDSAEKADEVIKRVYKRLYNSRGRHNIMALMPDEPRPVKFEVLVAEWDIHKLKSLEKR